MSTLFLAHHHHSKRDSDQPTLTLTTLKLLRWMVSYGQLVRMLGGASHSTEGKPLPCSGRGKCTTNLHECGGGTFNSSATPCCSCQLGFAGAGCTQLDVRVYIALGGAATLAVLVAGMFVSAAMSALTRKRLKSSSLGQGLLAGGR